MAVIKPLASLSLDLDNLWSYMKTHGDPGWEDLPSYLDLVVPRVLGFLKERGLCITFFIVGQDAALERNRDALAAIVRAGHEVGNHSFAHEPWLHLYEPRELEREVALAEKAIEAVTGQRPAGFRGPGFSLSAATLRVLKRRGYRYDASTFPTFLGPLARAYYFATAKLSVEQRAERAALFGGIREGLRPTGAYRWDLPEGPLLEVPVTTLPGLKIPFHASYLLYLAGYSPAAARAYFRLALRICRVAGVQPSLLLHPLDFLGRDDLDTLAFFPGMNQPAARKLARLSGFLDEFERTFEVVPLGRHAEALEASLDLPLRAPRFAAHASCPRSPQWPHAAAQRLVPAGGPAMKEASRTAAGGWSMKRIDARLGWVLGFVAVLAFYLATTPENRTEAVDGYRFAYHTERLPLTHLYGTRHLLFPVIMSPLYRAVSLVHDGVNAHDVVLMISALSASACLVLFARLLNRHLGLSLATSLLGAGFLGATYGFWRYAVEVEVYAPSLFFIMAVLNLVFAVENRAEGMGRWIILVTAGALAGLAVLFYQPNAIPLFLALPVLFLYRGGFPRLVAYGAAGGSVILLGYGVAFLVKGQPVTIAAIYMFVTGSDAFGEYDIAPLSSAVLGLGHVIVSGNWVFGLPDIVSSMSDIVPHRNYAKRVFAASTAGDLLIYLSVFTLVAVMVVGIYTALTAFKASRPPLGRHVAFALTWFALYAFTVMWLSPAAQEAWIMALPPLVILFAVFVIEPCVRAGRRTAPIILLAALVLHNAVGGIAIVYGTNGDYNRVKGAWILENATANDLILVSMIDGFFKNFLCYVGELRVVTAGTSADCRQDESRSVFQLIEMTRRAGGRIFAFDEVLEPPVALRVYASYANELDLAERFRGKEQPVYRSAVGTTYELH